MAIREITPEERSKLTLRSGKMSPVGLKIRDLPVGGHLQIDYADYPHKNGPRYIIWRLQRKSSRRYKWWWVNGKEGFLVDRLK